MIDLAQGLLVVVIVVLTTLLVVIGIQVVNILREFKKSLEKVNKILDDAGIISENVAKPLSDVAGFFKMIGLLVDFVRERKEEKQEKQGEQEQEKQEKPSRRRFFFKKGKKLA